MSIIHPVSKHGGSCVFLLVVLSVSELQAALCLSLLGTEEYCCSSPLDLSQALRLLRDLPPPLHTHLLMLLGQPTEGSNQRTRSSAGQRLIQYPAPPLRAASPYLLLEGVPVPAPGGGPRTCSWRGSPWGSNPLSSPSSSSSSRYLLLEGVPVGFSERCHVFSSFFFRQLSRRRAQGEEVPALLTREVRHQRVKTWTRHVDIFTKDFLFVPVNQEAHWYLLVICFPGLEGVQHQDWAGPVAEHQGKGSTDKSKAKPSASTLRPPECSQAGCERGRVLKRSCILVMDSLRLSAHENACRLLREYLQVEWQGRRGKARLFTPDTVCSAVCRLPLQDNSSDCGLYLLQYAESFLQNPVVHFDLPTRSIPGFYGDWLRRVGRAHLKPGAPTATRPSEGRPLIPLARRLDGNGGPPTTLLHTVPGEEPSLGSPRGTRGHQGEPGATQSNLGSPRGTRGSPRGTCGSPRGTRGHPEEPGGHLEEPGVTQGNLGSPRGTRGSPRGTRGHPGEPGVTKGNQGVTKGNQGVTQRN
ncbi:unnamed protein product [Gadus morhua 'NCC']